MFSCQRSVRARSVVPGLRRLREGLGGVPPSVTLRVPPPPHCVGWRMGGLADDS